MWGKRLQQGQWVGDQALRVEAGPEPAEGEEDLEYGKKSGRIGVWETGLQALVPTCRRQQQGARWEVIYGNTVEGPGRAMELDVALQAFDAAVEVDGAKGGGQLAKQLDDLGGQEGWRLELVRLTAGDLAPAVSAVCVVSEARPRRGRVFRMMALAVDGVVRGQGLATEAMTRMKAELLLVAGPRFERRADLASCMKKGGARFYAS